MKSEVIYCNPQFIEVGERAEVFIVSGHYKEYLDGEWVSTSIVQNYDPTTGIFETKNSIYKPNQING